ncbi:MAG: hypothetical protein DMD35_16345 [Gemmatimonadetes bacterium]|nr:MAG: hypothetical protein DMD35_16345 [Gemmatimonadota bacterium]
MNAMSIALKQRPSDTSASAASRGGAGGAMSARVQIPRMMRAEPASIARWMGRKYQVSAIIRSCMDGSCGRIGCSMAPTPSSAVPTSRAIESGRMSGCTTFSRMHDGLEPSTYAEASVPATRASTEMSPQTETLASSIADNDMRGRVCLVTGASRGLGKATALGLARLGATVVLLARDERLLSAARDDVAASSGNPHVSSIVADLASFDDIRVAAQELRARHEALHVLIHNAGVNPTKRKLSADGIELTLAVNHLAPFLLTHELLPALRRGGHDHGARVVTVASMFERFGRIAFHDVQGARRWIGPLAYTQSKLANVLFTFELAERLAGTGITANCVDPGLVATDLMREHVLFRPRWLKAVWGRVLASPTAGARAAVHAASAPEIATVTGKCFDRYGREVRTSRQSRDPATRERLWTLSEQLTGATFTAT